MPTYTGTGLSPTLVVLIHSKSRASQTSVVPIFTGSGKIVKTSYAHVWASIFLSTSLVLVLTKSALHQRFGCWSGLHWNLTELKEILGENLKESDLSQMCTLTYVLLLRFFDFIFMSFLVVVNISIYMICKIV